MFDLTTYVKKWQIRQLKTVFSTLDTLCQVSPFHLHLTLLIQIAPARLPISCPGQRSFCSLTHYLDNLVVPPSLCIIKMNSLYVLLTK